MDITTWTEVYQMDIRAAQSDQAVHQTGVLAFISFCLVDLTGDISNDTLYYTSL